jgi:type IV pilus assembly protein PilA
MKKQMQQGFTLIELMIVVAIIGILASIALPAYQDYIAKTQVNEPVVQVDALKLKAKEYFNKEGDCPDNTDATASAAGGIVNQYGIGLFSDYVGIYTADITTAGTAVTDGGCNITATFKNKGLNKGLQAKTITWTLYGQDANVPVWGCNTDVEITDYKLLPKECRFASLADYQTARTANP